MTDTFDGGSRRLNLSRWALEHPALTRYLMVVLLVLGFAAHFQPGQDEDPPFTFRAMVVQAFWPGASAQQMADQVTDKIEKALQEMPYADKIRSYAKPGESLTIFQLADSSPPKEVPNSWYQARKKVGDMRSSLPTGVIGPVFNDDFGDVYGSIFALSAVGFSNEELRVFAERAKQVLLRVPDVAKVELFGAQAEKLFIEISQRRLAQLGLDMNQVIAQIGAQNAVEGAGVLNVGSENLQVRVAGQFNSVEELKRLPIRAVNPTTGVASSLRLADIADIRRAYSDPPSVMVRHQGQQVVALGVSMAKGGDIIQLGTRLRAAAVQLQQDLPIGMTVTQVQDQPTAVTRCVGEFVRVLIEAVLIVLAVSFIALGLHTKPMRIDIWPGLVVGITIPLVLAVTFVAMFYWGVGLHKISLGSLIIALGLLVDDAIIAVEMMVRKLEEGYDEMRAATYAYEVTAMPMLTGTLITAAGFLPIGMAKSVTGEYTFAIFAVTAAALIISWVVSVCFVSYLGALLLRMRSHGPLGGGGAPDQPHELFDTPFYARFRAAVNWCVAHRWITIGLTMLTFALGLVGMGRVQQQFFPDSSRPEILIDLWLPEGSTIQQSDVLARRFEARLMKEAGVDSVTMWVGSGVPRFYLSAPMQRWYDSGPTRPRSCCVPTPACAASTTSGTSRSRCSDWRSIRTRRARSASRARASHRGRGRFCRAARSASTATATGSLTSCCASLPTSAASSPTWAVRTCPQPAAARCRWRRSPRPASPGSQASSGARAATTPSPCKATSSTACKGRPSRRRCGPRCRSSPRRCRPTTRSRSPARWRKAARARARSRPGCRSRCSSCSRC